MWCWEAAEGQETRASEQQLIGGRQKNDKIKENTFAIMGMSEGKEGGRAHKSRRESVRS